MNAQLSCALVALACTWTAGCAPLDCNPATSSSTRTSATSADPKPTARATASKELIEAIATGDLTTIGKLMPDGGIDLHALLDVFAKRSAMERLKLAHFVARNTSDAEAIGVLVRLCNDPDHEVYADAVRTLAYEVPDDVVRGHADEIMRVIEAHPEDATSGWLAAKLGSPRARRLVFDGKVASGMSHVERDLVLGKLGDAEAEQRSLARYHSAMNPAGNLRHTERWTYNMGRMGTPAAVRALARDLRHPGMYIRGHGSQRPVRADVVDGLIVAFPLEPSLQGEMSDAFYERVEKWTERRLGITWTGPPPPHVYEAPAPRYPTP